MSRPVFTIEKLDRHWRVMRDGKPVSGYYSGAAQAEERREVLERRARRTTRSCMTCRQPFLSEGPHNRMCAPCRKEGGGAGAFDCAVSVGRVA